MPLVNRTFDQLIDFTRTSAATFVNSSGNIASTPQSRNLLTFTQEFDNAAWSKARGSITANSTVAPDGTNTADTLTATATGSYAAAFRTSVSYPGGTAYTFSVYAKASAGQYLILYINETGDVGRAVFDLNSGATSLISAGTTASATSVGNGWWRCVVTATPSVTASGVTVIGVVDSGSATTVTSGKSIFIWGAQLEQASAATDYTRNFGGLFPPRFDYDPVTRAPRGLLIEEQRTNLLTYSEQFDNAAWTKLNATVTANATTSPDGTVDADFVVADTTNAQHGVYQAATAVSGTTYTHSVYAKAGGYNWLYMTEGNNVTAQASFNLATGALGTVSGTGSPSATITPVGNGWYRCTLTLTPISTAQNFQCRAANANGGGSFTGDGTSGIYLWGAQLEAGAFATSYIPTVASQVTRSADVAQISAPNFASWFNQTAGTFVAEFTATTLNASGITVYNAVSADAGSGANQISLYTYSNFAAGRVITSSVVQADINGGGSPANNAVIKSGIAYAANNVAVTVNGATPGTDTSVTLPTVDRLSIGSQTGGNYLNGWVRSIRYYPTRLTNAQLQALTA